EELPDELGPHGASKSAASRRFVAVTAERLEEWSRRNLSEMGLVVIMLDGIVIDEQTVIVAFGVDESGTKHPLGVWMGATENAVVCGELLDDLIQRGLDAHKGYLFVIDGSKGFGRRFENASGAELSCSAAKSTSVATCLTTFRSGCTPA